MKQRILKTIIAIVALVITVSGCGLSEPTGILRHLDEVEVTDCSYQVPEGMEYDKENDVHIKKDGDKTFYFSYWVTEGSGELRFFDDLNEDVCEEFEEQALEQIYGEEIDVEVINFETFEIDGLPTYRYDVSYEAGGDEITYTLLMTGADKVYNFSYEQVNTTEYGQSIENSIGSISFQYLYK